MNAKEYMKQIRTIDLKVIAIKEEIAEIRAVLGVQAINYDKIPGTSNGIDKTFQLICKLIDRQDALMQEYMLLSDTKQEIKQILYRLSRQVYAELLYKRYFEFKKWNVIGEEMFYSEDSMKRLHKIALEEVESLMLTPNNTE